MKYRPNWYPDKLSDRADWHDNQLKQLGESGADYGFTPADIAAATVDRDIVRFYAEKQTYLEAEIKEFRTGRDIFLDGNIGTKKPGLPTFDMAGFPADALVGVSERVEHFAKKLEGADNFTPAAAAAYRIVSIKPTPQPETDKKPVVKSMTALPMFGVSFKIPMQGASGIQSEMTRPGDPETHKRFYTDGDITDDTPPLEPGKAETRQYRFYYIVKNKIIGVSSDIVEVTVHQ